MRAVTATMRFRSSRVISGCPVTLCSVATRFSGNRWPSGARSSNFSRSGTVARTSPAVQTRTPISLGPLGICVVTLPVSRSFSCRVIASGSMPSRAALTRSTLMSSASPARTMPLLTSSTPSTVLMPSATARAVVSSTPGSSEKMITSMGWGTAVRSPIRSSISWRVSISSPGTVCSTRWRTSSMTSSIGRRGWGLRRTKRSPELASVSPPPNCRPVRRE